MSTPEDTPDPIASNDPAPKPENKEAPAETPAVPKPKFKVTRSPFAPKIEGAKSGGATKPPSSLPPKPAEASKPTAAPKPTPVAAPKPQPVAPSPVAPVAASEKKPIAGQPKPTGGQPKPMAPVSARKAAQMADEDDDNFSPLLIGVDGIAAIVAIAFGVLILIGVKG